MKSYGPGTHGIRSKARLDEIVERSLRDAAIRDEVKDRLKSSAPGLSIVKHAALLMHAQIHVDSRVDEGTVITVSFPENNE